MYGSDVTVVIPCYNHAHLLERAVHSALDCGAGEVIIVNDASTDNSAIVGKFLHRTNDRVVYLENPFRSGAIYSRNIAIHTAQSDLILPLDADDKLLDLQSLVDAIDFGQWVYGGWREYETDYRPPPPGMLPSKELGWVTMLFFKGDWLTVGGYDPDFSIGNEIWAFQRALLCASVQPVRVETPVFERTTDAPRTDRARAWAHLIAPLVNEKYPYPR